MAHTKPSTRKGDIDLERLASDITIAVWNRIAQLPQFAHLNPKDFASVYEAVYEEIKRRGDLSQAISVHFW